MDLKGAHILSVDQFERSDIEQVFDVADRMEPYARRAVVTRVLEGAVLGNMFFEPSTRTRISFGTAFNLLGGDVRETTEVKTSALAKGESLQDTARVLSGYSDIIVMRHETAGSVAEFASASRVPLELSTPPEIVEGLARRGHRVTETNRLEAGVSHVDIVYVTRTQAERFASPQEADQYRGLFRLNKAIYTAHCEPTTVIMHPLPRDQAAGELSPDLDENPNLAIFRQTDNGILVRMALFAMILDVVDQVDRYSRPVRWYRAQLS